MLFFSNISSITFLGLSFNPFEHSLIIYKFDYFNLFRKEWSISDNLLIVSFRLLTCLLIILTTFFIFMSAHSSCPSSLQAVHSSSPHINDNFLHLELVHMRTIGLLPLHLRSLGYLISMLPIIASTLASVSASSIFIKFNIHNQHILLNK